MLRAAAELEGTTVSEYVLDHVLGQAESDVVDRRRIVVHNAAAWREFQALLAGPRPPNPALDRLRARKPVWERGPDVVFTENGKKLMFIVQVRSDAKDAVRLIAPPDDLTSEEGWETIVVGAVEERDAVRSA